MRSFPQHPAAVAVAAVALLLCTGQGPARAVPASEAVNLPPAAGAAGTARYIVQLEEPPLATFGAAASGGGSWDGDSPAALAQARLLARRQAAIAAAVQSLAPAARAQYHYRLTFNGLVFRLSAAEALAVRRLPGVAAVTREERVLPLMDTSLDQIHAPAAWADARVGGRAGAGRGVRIAVIDAGLSAGHPFFADAGFQAPEGFPRASLTVGDVSCGYSAEDAARFTNQKVIVARSYVNPDAAAGRDCQALRAEFTPLAAGLGGFHGAHVAGIAAGTSVLGGPGASGAGKLSLSGVAPGAYLMAYKFTDAYTPEILRMIEDAVADGADVINNSWGSAAMNVLDPARHPVAQAFAAASQAGVVVVAAAGNAGTNGEATLGGPHQMSPDVITVANVQTGRSFRFTVKASDADLPAQLLDHPASYVDGGKPFDVIEADNFAGDLCNVVTALRVRGKVALASAATECQGAAIPGLPIQLPPQLTFLYQLVIAQQLGARAAVLVVADEQQAQLLAQALPFVSLLNLELPITAVISGPKATALYTYGQTHPAMKLRLDSTPERVLDPAASDGAHPTTSQGPAPTFAGATLKPDLAAPGTDILSANTAQDGAPSGYTTATGTSMASPQVAGAAAVLRQAWPSWTPAEVKAALMSSADPVVRVGTATAPATVQGAGRLNLEHALDPELLIVPASLNLGLRSSGDLSFSLNLRDVRLAGAGDAVWQLRHEPGPGNTALTPTLPAEVVVPKEGRVSLPVRFALGQDLAAGDYDGRIVFTLGDRTLRVVYFLRVPGDRKDVLLLNARRSAGAAGGGFPGGGAGYVDTPDYSAYWTAALGAAGLSHDVWTVAEGQQAGTPPLHLLQRYDVVMLASGDGNAPLDRLEGGMTALQMYLLGGGRLVASGGKWPHGLGLAQAATLQNSGAMYFLSRYFAGFELVQDDAALTMDLQPVRLFDAPVALAKAPSAEAAGNGASLDLGRPLAELVTAGGAGQPAPDLGIAAPGVVDRLLPYMRPYLEASPGAAAMTGVTPDATLEQPRRADDIPWRAMFAGFGLEAVAPLPDHADRATVLRALYDWCVEPADVRLTIEGPDQVRAGREVSFVADASSPSGVQVVGWRWDLGDGRPFVTTASSTLKASFDRFGPLTVRAEALTEHGHTWVAEKQLRVGGARLFLPWASKTRR